MISDDSVIAYFYSKEQMSPLTMADCEADCALNPLKDRFFNPMSGVKSDQDLTDGRTSK